MVGNGNALKPFSQFVGMGKACTDQVDAAQKQNMAVRFRLVKHFHHLIIINIVLFSRDHRLSPSIWWDGSVTFLFGSCSKPARRQVSNPYSGGRPRDLAHVFILFGTLLRK